jgi:hypothetical protein
MELKWQSLTPSNSPKFMVKGTELNQAIIPGYNSRYALVEVRTYDVDRQADRGYSIRDAATVSDQDIKDGKRPKQIKFFNHEDDAINFIKSLKE